MLSVSDSRGAAQPTQQQNSQPTAHVPTAVASLLESPTMPARLHTSISGASTAMELTQDDICQQAWYIMADPKKVLTVPELSTYLESLGLLGAADLKECEKEELASIAAMLKPLQRRKF